MRSPVGNATKTPSQTRSGAKSNQAFHPAVAEAGWEAVASEKAAPPKGSYFPPALISVTRASTAAACSPMSLKVCIRETSWAGG